MNEKIQAILLKIVRDLKKYGWSVDDDWEVTLKGEGHVPLAKNIPVDGDLGDGEWRSIVETTIDLKLESDDQLTFFPGYTIYANIFVDGGPSHDIVYKSDADVAFTEKDVGDDKKTSLAAKKISDIVSTYIGDEYSNYIDQNGQAIMNYSEGGWRADSEEID